MLVGREGGREIKGEGLLVDADIARCEEESEREGENETRC